MTDIVYLLIYLGIASVLGFVANRSGMDGFSSWLDRAANGQVRYLRDAKRISMVGETREVRSFAGRAVHRVTIGTRLLSTGLVGALLFVIDGLNGLAPGTFVPEGYETPVLLGSVALALYYLAFIWSYRLVREDHMLHIPTLLFGRQTRDPRTLTRIEDDGAYLLRLYFDGAGRAEVLKYVEGRVGLVTELEGYLASASRNDAAPPMEISARRGI